MQGKGFLGQSGRFEFERRGLMSPNQRFPENPALWDMLVAVSIVALGSTSSKEGGEEDAKTGGKKKRGACTQGKKKRRQGKTQSRWEGIGLRHIVCGGSLEEPTRKPRHASVLSTHSDTQAVPAFHCIRMFKGISSTRALLEHTDTLPLL